MGKGNQFPAAIFKGTLEDIGVLVAAENPKITSLLAVPAIHAGLDLDRSRSEHKLGGTFLPLGVGLGFDFDFHR